MHGYSNGKPNKWSQPMQCSKKYNQSERTLASVGAQRFGLRHHRNHFDMPQVVNHSIWDVICFTFLCYTWSNMLPGIEQCLREMVRLVLYRCWPCVCVCATVNGSPRQPMLLLCTILWMTWLRLFVYPMIPEADIDVCVCSSGRK